MTEGDTRQKTLKSSEGRIIMRVQRNIGKRKRFMKLGKYQGKERKRGRERGIGPMMGPIMSKERERTRKRKREHAV